LILTFILYLIMFKLTKNEYLSLLSVPILYLPEIFSKPYPGKIISELLFYRQGLFFLGQWSRVLIENILLFLFILIFVKYVYNNRISLQKDYKNLLICAVIIGLLFYSSLFHWTFIYAGIGILAIYSFILKKYNNVKKIIFIYLSSAILLIPYLLLYLKNTSQNSYPDVIARAAIQYSSIDLTYTPFFIAVIVVFWSIHLITGKKELGLKENFYLIFSFLIGLVVLLNQHIITHFSIEPAHYYLSNGSIWIMLTIIVSIQYLVSHYKIKSKFNVLFLILFIVIIGIFAINQVRNSNLLTDYYKIENNQLDAINWFNENAKPEEVVVSLSERNNMLIPAYTDLNIMSTFAIVTSSTTDENIERHYIKYKIFNTSNKVFTDFVSSNERQTDGYSWLFVHKYHKSSLEKGELPPHVLNKLIREYAEYDIQSFLKEKKYRLDYILYTEYDKNISQIDRDFLLRNGFTLEYNKPGIQIYKNNN